MPYTETQRNWLAKLVDIDPTGWATDESQRQALLDDVTLEVNSLRDRLKSGFHQTLVERSPKYKLGFIPWGEDTVTHETVRDDGDLQQEIDMRSNAEMENVDALAIESHRQLIHSQDEIEHLAQRMRSATDAQGNRLFSDADIMNELYTPLVNARVMSDQQVPAQYSEINQTFENAARLYDDQLKRLATAKSANDRFQENVESTVEYIKFANELAEPFAELYGESVVKKITKATSLACTAAELTATLKIEERPWNKGSAQAISIICDALDIVYGKLGEKLKTAIEGSTQMVSAQRNYSEGKYQAACTDLGASLKSCSKVADLGPRGKASMLAAAELFSSAEHSDTIRQAVHDKDYGQIITTLTTIGVSARKVYLSNLKHPKPKKGDPPLTEEQEAYNAELDRCIERAENVESLLTTPQTALNGIEDMRKSFQTGDPQKFLGSLIKMGTEGAKKALKGMRHAIPPSGQTELSDEQKDWNKLMSGYLKRIEEFEAAQSIVGNIPNVIEGIKAYKLTGNRATLMETISKFGQESAEAAIKQLKHPKPEDEGEKLTDEQKKENEKLDNMLLLIGGTLDVVHASARASEREARRDSRETARVLDDLSAGAVKLAQANDVELEATALGVDTTSAGAQALLSLMVMDNDAATTHLEKALKNSNTAKDLLLDAFEIL